MRFPAFIFTFSLEKCDVRNPKKEPKENIKEIQHKINLKPRLAFDFEEPKNVFYKFVA